MAQNYNKAFGKALRAARNSSGKTQSQASMALKNSASSHSLISNYESGKISPTPVAIYTLANAYQTTPEDIFANAREYLNDCDSSTKEEDKN